MKKEYLTQSWKNTIFKSIAYTVGEEGEKVLTKQTNWISGRFYIMNCFFLSVFKNSIDLD